MKDSCCCTKLELGWTCCWDGHVGYATNIAWPWLSARLFLCSWSNCVTYMSHKIRCLNTDLLKLMPKHTGNKHPCLHHRRVRRTECRHNLVSKDLDQVCPVAVGHAYVGSSPFALTPDPPTEGMRARRPTDNDDLACPAEGIHTRGDNAMCRVWRR